MPLPSDYGDDACSLARALEIIGSRWTLLIVRDAFWGVRRFGDFADQLGMPRSVLTSRLKDLISAGVMRKVAGERHLEYELTPMGRGLWPVVFSLTRWGDEACSPDGPERLFEHASDGGAIGAHGQCVDCETIPQPEALVVRPGPGYVPARHGDSWVDRALSVPHRLLEPLRPPGA